MPRGPDFFRSMTPDAIASLEEYARDRSHTIVDVAGYLQDLGVPTSRSAVGRWMQDFRAWDDSVRRTAVARGYAGHDHDAPAIGEAIARELDGRVMDKLVSGEPLSTKELRDLAATRRDVTRDRMELVELRKRGNEQFDALNDIRGRRAITEADIEAARKAAFG